MNLEFKLALSLSLSLLGEKEARFESMPIPLGHLIRQTLDLNLNLIE